MDRIYFPKLSRCSDARMDLCPTAHSSLGLDRFLVGTSRSLDDPTDAINSRTPDFPLVDGNRIACAGSRRAIYRRGLVRFPCRTACVDLLANLRTSASGD